jgi:hypothetical protein
MVRRRINLVADLGVSMFDILLAGMGRKIKVSFSAVVAE